MVNGVFWTFGALKVVDWLIEGLSIRIHEGSSIKGSQLAIIKVSHCNNFICFINLDTK